MFHLCQPITLAVSSLRITPQRSGLFCKGLLALLLLLSLAHPSVASAIATKTAKLDFARDVRPILSNRCFKCHGPDEATRKGKLRLDLRESALGSGESGFIAIIPGNPTDSELYRRLHAHDPKQRMPPASAKMELTDGEKHILKRWIEEGAEYRPHWAFIAPVKPAGANSIDEFVQQKLEEENLTRSPQAGKLQLIRRVTLDLIGLPPSAEEIKTFVEDSSPNAYERLVDRLLASPHYGERWARRWLDLARYADTNGYEKDRERQIWPWRDWVIRAINDDMPFDAFTIKQLAGDMLPNATRDDIIATGFHRNSMLNEEGGNDPLEFRYHAMADRVATTGSTWLGLTLGCAQCHTHKYDPILHTEYFGLMAYLNNADDVYQDLPDSSHANKVKERTQKAEALIAQLPQHWPVKKPETASWTTPQVQQVITESGAHGKILSDHTVLFATPQAEKDVYEFILHGDPKSADRLRLETLADPALATGGPGHTPHGNFVLSEIEVFSRPTGSQASWQRHELQTATSVSEQPGFPAAHAIDQQAETGWAVHVKDGSHKKNRSAIFHFFKPLPNRDLEFKIRLVQNYGSYHTIGKTRLSFGSPLKDPPQHVSEAELRKQQLDEAFEKWLLQQQQHTVQWHPLIPIKLHSNEPILTIEPDHSIFVSGDTTKDDQFTLVFDDVPAGATQLRLETLTDPRLPGFGPGRVYYEGQAGDFFLYDLTLLADDQPVSFSKASSTIGDAMLAVDDNLLTGWTIKEGISQNQTAVFIMAQPLPAAKKITITLRMGRYFASTLGKFRLSVSHSNIQTQARVLPDHLEQALSQEHLQQTQRLELFRHFLLNSPSLKDAVKPIKELLKPLTPPRTLVLQERYDFPRLTKLHTRGEFTQPAQTISPHLPAFLITSTNSSTKTPSNRLEFAQWLVSADNPLTSRVIVNQHWQAFFGTGLVRTLDDFGFQGEPPSHPSLLDWLAINFMENGWSVKQLHRLIVSSETYKQDSKISPEAYRKDPQNRFLARGPRLRLEAELIRDLALKAAGLLSFKQYGPSVRPPQPDSVTEGAYGGMSWPISSGEDRYRRGLYTFAKRSAPFASFQAFDAPTGEACMAKRDVSNTPLQSLVLLNDEVFYEAAQALGKLIDTQKLTDEEKVSLAFQRCLTRQPTLEEQNVMLDFFHQQKQRLHAGELSLQELMPEGASVEAAAWMTVARVLLNLDETITKN